MFPFARWLTSRQRGVAVPDRSVFLATVAARWSQLDPDRYPFVHKAATQPPEPAEIAAAIGALGPNTAVADITAPDGRMLGQAAAELDARQAAAPSAAE